jgi:hypothetical protein
MMTDICGITPEEMTLRVKMSPQPEETTPS